MEVVVVAAVAAVVVDVADEEEELRVAAAVLVAVAAIVVVVVALSRLAIHFAGVLTRRPNTVPRNLLPILLTLPPAVPSVVVARCCVVRARFEVGLTTGVAGSSSGPCVRFRDMV